VTYFDRISIKPHDPVFDGSGDLPPIEDILTMNRDMESFVIQASATETLFLQRSTYEPLQFVHFSDVHAVLELWNRMVEYINHYRDYIAFALHTGDYCGDNQEQYRDFYTEGTPCVRPILNCAGNHDTITGPNWVKTEKEETWKRLFNSTENWDVSFLNCPFSMSYYRDFPESNIRLIVLDQYYDRDVQLRWLKEILDDADEKGLWVITAMHEPSAEIVKPVGVTFHTLTKFSTLSDSPFESVLADFVKKGGRFICNLCGHEHHDLFGYTAGGVLNVAVECACDWSGWCDGKRVRGTRTYDCFNVVSIDTDLGILKLVRVGNNADYYLRKKQVLCYDYQNRCVVFNG
jgi:hypothetical protein